MICQCNFEMRCMKTKKMGGGREEVLERWMQMTLILQLYFYTEDVPIPLLLLSSSNPFFISLFSLYFSFSAPPAPLLPLSLSLSGVLAPL